MNGNGTASPQGYYLAARLPADLMCLFPVPLGLAQAEHLVALVLDCSVTKTRSPVQGLSHRLQDRGRERASAPWRPYTVPLEMGLSSWKHPQNQTPPPGGTPQKRAQPEPLVGIFQVIALPVVFFCPQRCPMHCGDGAP